MSTVEFVIRVSLNHKLTGARRQRVDRGPRPADRFPAGEDARHSGLAGHRIRLDGIADRAPQPVALATQEIESAFVTAGKQNRLVVLPQFLEAHHVPDTKAIRSRSRSTMSRSPGD